MNITIKQQNGKFYLCDGDREIVECETFREAKRLQLETALDEMISQ